MRQRKDPRLRAIASAAVRESAGVPMCPKHDEPLRDRSKPMDGVGYGALEFYCESCEAGRPPKTRVGTTPEKIIQCFCFHCASTFTAKPPKPGEAPARYCRKVDCQRAARSAGLPVRKDRTA